MNYHKSHNETKSAVEEYWEYVSSLFVSPTLKMMLTH
jgi:hypothetical protein